MKYYVGLDVAMEETAICIVEASGWPAGIEGEMGDGL